MKFQTNGKSNNVFTSNWLNHPQALMTTRNEYKTFFVYANHYLILPNLLKIEDVGMTRELVRPGKN